MKNNMRKIIKQIVLPVVAGGLLAMTPQLMSAAEPQDVETIDAENHEIGYGIINPGVAMSTVSGDHF